ncbi:MAG: FtsX-like permease family protein, partial [Candidatus Thorarchaeota archaeon]
MSGEMNSRSWSLFYSLSSIRRQSLKNAGIVLFLALNIAIPAIVFTWTETSTYMMLDEHLSQNSYQLRVVSSTYNGYPLLEELSVKSDSYDAIEAIDHYPSTVGILANSNIPQWSWYWIEWPMPRFEIIDFRVLPVTNDVVQRIKGEFVWEGNSSIQSGQVLVSERFVYHCRRTYNISITPGMIMGIDILTDPPTDRFGNLVTSYPSNTDHSLVENLTIAGIYKLRTLMTVAAEAFPSVFRPDPWPETMWDMESVLGLEDSVMLFKSNITEDTLEDMSNEGFFPPVSLVKGDIDELIEIGPKNIEQHFQKIQLQIIDEYPLFNVRGLDYLDEITAAVENYERGQMLTLIALPIIFLGLYITAYTTESTLSTRKMEIRILRSKGASYNQITASIMWESAILAILGLFTGLLLTITLTPVMWSTKGFLLIDLLEYVDFLNHIRISLMTLALSVTLCLFVPGLYLYHIEKRIDAYEVGSIQKAEEEKEIKESKFLRLLAMLLVILVVIMLIPYIILPEGAIGIYTLISLGLLLIITSFLGSRVVQIGVSYLFEKAKMILGEKSLYVTMSLRRRRDRFIPLMIILTVSLSSSVMMIMEGTSFVTTIDNDVVYSYGADLRLEMYIPYDYGIIDTLFENYSIDAVTPVKSHSITWGAHSMFLKGLIPEQYLQIGTFYPDSFVNSTPEETLMRLQETTDGIVIPQYYAELYNYSIGDHIRVSLSNVRSIEFEIVGTMNSAPGFGYACPNQQDAVTIGDDLGLQVRKEGFMLANLNQIILKTWVFETDLYLAKASPDANFTGLYDALIQDFRVNLLTPHWNRLPERELLVVGEDSVFYSRRNPIYEEIDRFSRGVEGITFVCTIICIIMALSAISLFFGSAILERKPEYAIFRAIGSTQQQVYNMVFSEFSGLVLAALCLSAFIGIIVGYSTTFIIFGISPFVPIVPKI